MAETDARFYFDPVCPFAWMTSKWVRVVQRQRGYHVDWRFISLWMVNADVDYETHFPPGYIAGHTAGLRLLRVAAAARARSGPDAVGRFYAAAGGRIFDSPPDPAREGSDGGYRGTREFVAPILADAGLPADLAGALDDESFDVVIRNETDEALALTGKDVGTPIIQLDPPEGLAFFGPVISRKVGDDEAEQLWDHVVGLTRFPGFAELKRSLRERPQLAAYGVGQGEVGLTEDWHGGSRRQHR
jgi:Mycothiol-dependent nitroreductase Rv2466c